MSIPSYEKGLDTSVMDNPGSTDDIVKKEPTVYRVYKIRWLVLAIFVLYSASNAFQWIQYSIIADIVMRYYNVNATVVDWTSMVYMVTYIPLIFPASWLLDKVGLRTTTIIGAVGTCAGSWLKVFSVPQDMFWMGFLGQTVVAISQIFILNVPPRLAAVWFGPNQVSSACSIGVFGNQLGVAVGFLLPPMIVRNSVDDAAGVASDLRLLFLATAGFTTGLLVLILIFFKSAPQTPPSAAQEYGSSLDSEFFQSIKRLMINTNYILLLITYGINVGCFYAISTLLNQVVLLYYPGANEDAGRIGLVIVCAGMAGSVLCGLILDKTRRFKETILTVYAFTVVGMVVFTFTLNTGVIAVVYFSGVLLGFFMNGYLPVGFEYASEITYPEPEGTVCGILNAAVQVFGIVFTIIYGALIKSIGDQWANICLCVLLVIGTALTAVIKSDLKRQSAQAMK